MKNIFLIALLSFGICLSCKDDDQRQDDQALPQATQSGANTGGAKVNGKIWVALTEPPTIGNGITGTSYRYVNGLYELQIYLRNVKDPTGSSIGISLQSTTDFKIGQYELNDLEGNTGTYFNAFTGGYITNANNTGVLNITKFDKENKTISGTFSFKAQYSSSSDVVIITDGRFDKKYFLN